jgi:hypothetical protein
MTRKRDDNSPETDPKAEMKSPDRRHLLGLAALAAVSAGQAGSAVAQTHRAKKPRAVHPAAPHVTCEQAADPDPTGMHGPLEPPQHTAGYLDVDSFNPLAATKVFQDAKVYRRKVSDYAKQLRAAMNLPKEDFRHVIRLEHLAHNDKVVSADCGCGCS